MQIKIKTRNHFKALSLFLDLPFYKIKNLILKDDLVLNIEHIQSIDHAKTNFAEIYYINYKNKHHHGQIILYDVDPKNFEEIKINEIKFDQDKHFRDFFLDFKFYLISPITINILYSIFFGFGFIKFSGLLFPEFEHPKLYTNAICNVECVTKTSNAMVALIFLLLMLYLPMILNLTILKYCHKYSNLNHYKKAFLSAILLSLVNLLLIGTSLDAAIKSNLIASAQKIYNLRYNQTYINKHAAREISSEDIHNSNNIPSKPKQTMSN